MSEVIKQDLKTEALKLALETMNLARAAHGQMLLSDPPQEAWKAWGVSAALTKAMTAAREALADHTEQPLEMVAEQPAQGCDYCNHPQYAGTKCNNCGREQPAQQHIEHCIWARNGNAPCPHVQPAQQQEPPTVAELLCVCGAEWEWRNRDWELVATPPASKPLTDEQLWENDQIMSLNADLGWHMDTIRMFARAIEAKLREKNAQPSKPLHQEHIFEAYRKALGQYVRSQDEAMVLKFARAIEAAHGIKGDA